MRATMEPVLSFRQYRATDDSFIADLASQAFTEYSSRSVPTTLKMARSGVTWLACRGVDRLGFAVVSPGAFGQAELSAIAVQEQARGMGIGSALLGKVERVLALAGFTDLALHTARANLGALDLFLKRGFRVEQRLPRFYRGVFDAIALRKRLAPVR